MEKQLTVNEYCDLFIKRIYDVAQNEGMDHNQSSDEIAEHFNIESFRLTKNIFDILLSTELIDNLCMLANGTIVFHITGKGLSYVEGGGKTGIIKTYLTNSKMYTDNSVNIQTNLGQAFTGSTNITQNITVNDLQKLVSALEQTKVLLQNSNESKDVKEDGLLTIESIQTEIKKKNPIISIVEQGLSALSNIASIGSFIKSFLPS